MLVDMCNKMGWDRAISELGRIVLQNENIQAELFAGTPSQVRQAVKLSKTIIQRNITFGRLKQYRIMKQKS